MRKILGILILLSAITLYALPVFGIDDWEFQLAPRCELGGKISEGGKTTYEILGIDEPYYFYHTLYVAKNGVLMSSVDAECKKRFGFVGIFTKIPRIFEQLKGLDCAIGAIHQPPVPPGVPGGPAPKVPPVTVDEGWVVCRSSVIIPPR